MKQAIYNKKMHWLTYWNSHNTQVTINCRSLGAAKLVILTQEKINKVKQILEEVNN